MRRLIIAEKGSVAQAIADVLGVTGKGRNFIECGDVTLGYCDGHLFELPYRPTTTQNSSDGHLRPCHSFPPSSLCRKTPPGTMIESSSWAS